LRPAGQIILSVVEKVLGWTLGLVIAMVRAAQPPVVV
jgi:hypothetical protein